MELKGSKTEANLNQAFSSECRARTKYEFFAAQARKDGYQQIAQLFDETARNEKEHAEMWYKALNGAMPETLPALKDAMQTENHEWTDLYDNFAKTAREEGFDDIADLFERTSSIEKAHEERFKTLARNIQRDRVFKKSKEIVWKCNNCGYLHRGKNAPDRCPMCDHPQAHFRKQETGYV